MGPQRWDRILKKHGVPVENWRDAKRLPPAAELNHQWASPVASYLVPGGRFLVIVLKLGNCTFRLEVWVLGVPGRSGSLNPICIAFANLDMEEDAPRCDMSVSVEGDDILRIGLVPYSSRVPEYNLPARTRALIRVLSIPLGQDNPELVEDAAFYVNIRTQRCQILIQAGLVILHSGSYLFAYEIGSRRYTAWRCDILDSDHLGFLSVYPDVVLAGGFLAIMCYDWGRNNLQVWNLSDMERRLQPIPASGMHLPLASDMFRPCFAARCPWPVDEYPHMWTHRLRSSVLLLSSYFIQAESSSPVYAFDLTTITGDQPPSVDESSFSRIAEWAAPQDSTDPLGYFVVQGLNGIAYRRRQTQFDAGPPQRPEVQYAFFLHFWLGLRFDFGR